MSASRDTVLTVQGVFPTSEAGLGPAGPSATRAGSGARRPLLTLPRSPALHPKPPIRPFSRGPSPHLTPVR